MFMWLLVHRGIAVEVWLAYGVGQSYALVCGISEKNQDFAFGIDVLCNRISRDKFYVSCSI